jgi:hypothetical protein
MILEQDKNILTREILFEKIGNLSNEKLLFDFKKLNWDIDENVISIIEHLKEQSKNKILLGEFVSENNNSDIVNLKNVSHYIENLEFYKNKFYGDIVFVDSDIGKIAMELFLRKQIKTTVRALGFYNDGKPKVVDLITIDLITI